MATAAPPAGKYEPFPIKVHFNSQTRVLQLKDTTSYYTFCQWLLATFQQSNTMTCIIRYLDSENDLIDVCADFEFEEMCRQYHHGAKKAPLRVQLNVVEAFDAPVMKEPVKLKQPEKLFDGDDDDDEAKKPKLADDIARGLLRNGGAPFLQRDKLDKDELKQMLAEIEKDKNAAENAKIWAILRAIASVFLSIVLVNCHTWGGGILVLVLICACQHDNIARLVAQFNKYVKEKEEKEMLLHFAKQHADQRHRFQTTYRMTPQRDNN